MPGDGKGLALYRHMVLTRALEERLVALKRQGRVPGGVYRSLGQEAGAVGSAAALDVAAGDVVCPMIRDLGAILVAGVAPGVVLSQYLATTHSPSRGRDLHICFSAIRHGVLGHIAPLGTMLPVMAGVALAFRMRGEPRVALVYAGEGTLSTGAAHEGINLAAVQRLPLVIVAQSNGYAYSTPSARQTATRRLSDRAAGYGIPAAQVDGNDVFAVFDAARQAVAHARAGGGPVFLDLITYRLCGHAEHDDKRYVPAGESEGWASRDPLVLCARRLLAEGEATAATLRATDDAIAADVERAADVALAESAPAPESALADVLARPAPDGRWYREAPHRTPPSRSR